MAEDPEQKPVPQPPRREISRRPVVVGLIGLAAVEAVAGGITWKVLYQGLRKIALAFAPPIPTPTSIPPGATLYIYRGHSGGVNAVKWFPDSKRIVSGADDQTAQVWDATTGRHAFIYRSQTGGVRTVARSPDGKHIASGGGAQIPTTAPTDTPTPTPVPTDTPVPLIPLDTPTPVPTDTPTPTPVPPLLTPSALSFTVNQGDNSTSQALMLTNTNSTNILWSTSSDSSWLSTSPGSGTLDLEQTTSITVTVSSANLSPGTYAAIITITFTPEYVNGDIPVALTVLPVHPTVEVWEAATGIKYLTYLGHKDLLNEVAWSPDGARIASASADKTVQIWDATTGLKVFSYHGHTDAVYSAAWSPDGKYIASASRDATVQVWSTISLSSVYTYTRHVASVNSVDWSLDGKYIASAGRDTTVQVWKAI